MVDDNSESIEAHEVVLDVNNGASKNCEESVIKDSVPLLKKVSLLNSSFFLYTELIEISYFQSYNIC